MAQSSCCTPIMSRHALVGTPPGSLPCDCFSFPLATNHGYRRWAQLSSWARVLHVSTKVLFPSKLKCWGYPAQKGLAKGWGYPAHKWLGLSSPKAACQRLGLSSPQVVGAIQPKRCLPKVGAIQPTSGWGYPAQKVLAKGWGYPAQKCLGYPAQKVLPKAGAFQPKSVGAIQPKRCCNRQMLSFSPMPFCLCFSQLSSSLSKL